ncbi:hypothetical protein RQP46_006769 [Phenoliferia psychrophenolica]
MVDARPEHLYTSARYDRALLDSPTNVLTVPPSTPSPYLLLPYHRDRLVAAARAFAWTDAAASLDGEAGLVRLLAQLDSSVEAHEASAGVVGPLKVRILLSPSGSLTIELSPTPPIPTATLFLLNHSPSSLQSHPSPMPVHLDPLPTDPSLFTSHKTTSRAHYLDSRARAGLGPGYAKQEEVILFNPADEVMEASISNVAFWRDGSWRTPRLQSGGLGGVMRRWALERGGWTEGTVRREDVKPGEYVLLSNALRGIFVGKVV